MTRERAFQVLTEHGWAPSSSKMRKYESGSYQPFRKGKQQAWLGNYFLELDTEPTAFDFINSTERQLVQFLAGKISA